MNDGCANINNGDTQYGVGEMIKQVEIVCG